MFNNNIKYMENTENLNTQEEHSEIKKISPYRKHLGEVSNPQQEVIGSKNNVENNEKKPTANEKKFLDNILKEQYTVSDTTNANFNNIDTNIEDDKNVDYQKEYANYKKRYSDTRSDNNNLKRENIKINTELKKIKDTFQESINNLKKRNEDGYYKTDEEIAEEVDKLAKILEYNQDNINNDNNIEDPEVKKFNDKLYNRLNIFEEDEPQSKYKDRVDKLLSFISTDNSINNEKFYDELVYVVNNDIKNLKSFLDDHLDRFEPVIQNGAIRHIEQLRNENKKIKNEHDKLKEEYAKLKETLLSKEKALDERKIKAHNINNNLFSNNKSKQSPFRRELGNKSL